MGKLPENVAQAMEFERLLIESGATIKDCLIVAQKDRSNAIKNIVRVDRAPRRRRKAITQADIGQAVADALDAISSELRSHKNDLPRWAQAMDFAIAVVAKHRSKQ